MVAGEGSAGDPVREFALKPLGGAVVRLRPGTTDAAVLWDTFVRQFHLPPSGAPSPIRTILDLGANIGLTAAHYAMLYPEARILAVEMDDTNAELARVNTERWRDRVEILHAAAWHEAGSIRYGGAESWGLHVDENGTRRVSALSVESLIDRLGDSLDYLKMDVEGAEGPILEKSPAFLRRVRAINLEYHPPIVSETMEAILESGGFRVWPQETHGHCLLGVQRLA